MKSKTKWIIKGTKMMKSSKYISLFIALLLFGCNKTDSQNNISENNVVGYGGGSGDNFEFLEKLPMGDLNDAEKAGLIFMREEEKLAKDVYKTLFEQYEEKIFQNIARSEDRHTNAVLRLINRYDLEDPVKSDDIGVFVNQDLQGLYNALVAKGSANLVNALSVGAEIEEIDILDLRKYMTEVVENDDIIFVYDNLLRGSRNHLRAFTKTLANLDGNYVPQHLTREDYDEIISSEQEKGGKGKGKGRKGGRGGRGGNRGNGGRR